VDLAGLGEDDMMSFIRTAVEGILDPYAQNVYHLHQTVLDLSSKVGKLQEQSDSGLQEQKAATSRMQDMQQSAESARQKLNSFIDESGKINEEKAKSIQNLEETLDRIKHDMQGLMKNDEDTRTKITACQDMGKENRGDCFTLKTELQRVQEDLKITEKAHADTVSNLNYHKGLLDTEIAQNKALATRHEYLRDKCDTLHEQHEGHQKSLDERDAENQSQMKQYRILWQEFEQSRRNTAMALSRMKDELGLMHKETMAKVERIDTDLRSQVSGIDSKRKNLDQTLTENLSNQDQLWNSMKVVRGNMRDIEAITSKHELEVAALLAATGVRPEGDKGPDEKDQKIQKNKSKIEVLEEESELSGKRHLRVEKALGLEPLGKEKEKRGRQKRASTMMLGEDQLLRKAWTAWMEYRVEAKQNEVQEAVPKIQEMVKIHKQEIEEIKQLLTSNDQVKQMEADQIKLMKEVETIRKSLDLQRSHWQGMTRGLQAAKRPLGSLVSQLPGTSDVMTKTL